jgi:polyphenol oxidase
LDKSYSNMIRLNNNIKSNNLHILLFSGLSKYQNLVHFVTTRKGGYSQSPFDSFNLAFHVGDDPENVLKNRKMLAQYLHIPLNYFTISNQVHGDNISIVEQGERGSGAENISTVIEDSDAMITDQKDVCLLILVADCVPVIMYDKRKEIIAVIHAGWKGTVRKIAQKTFYLMESRFGCNPSDIICAIGPSIGPCCYQVGPEVVDLVREKFPKDRDLIQNIAEDGKGYFDLWEANRIQLLDCQIPEQNIEVARLCTCCHPDLFFSSRNDNGNTGRFAVGIMMKK